MKLSREEIQHIAKLARLRLSEKELEKYSLQLSSILEYFEQLQELSVENVFETPHATGLLNVFRDDEVEKIDAKTRDKIFKNMPEQEDDLLKTKSVFD